MVNEEDILEVEVLKYIKDNKMKFSKLYDKAALEAAKARVVEVIELEREGRDNLERIQKFLEKLRSSRKYCTKWTLLSNRSETSSMP